MRRTLIISIPMKDPVERNKRGAVLYDDKQDQVQVKSQLQEQTFFDINLPGNAFWIDMSRVSLFPRASLNVFVFAFKVLCII